MLFACSLKRAPSSLALSYVSELHLLRADLREDIFSLTLSSYRWLAVRCVSVSYLRMLLRMRRTKSLILLQRVVFSSHRLLRMTEQLM